MTKQELQHKVEILELKLQVKELELKIAELESNVGNTLAPFTPSPFPHYLPTYVGDGYGVPLDNPFPCTATTGINILKVNDLMPSDGVAGANNILQEQ